MESEMETQNNIILVGTDFSPSSERAFVKACAIARHTGERVHLLHIVEPVDEPGSQDRETQEFYAKLTQISETKLQEQEGDQGAIISLTHSVEIGPRTETLIRIGQEMNAGLIVLGSQPLSEGNPPRLGVSHRIALTSTRPVLLVP